MVGRRFNRSVSHAVAALGIVAGFSACGKNQPPPQAVDCAPDRLPSLGAADATGSARVFSPDPIAASGKTSLSPTYLGLDEYAAPVTLEHLGGHGVLEGSYVDVRNGISCGEWFGAYDASHQFEYPHSNPHFQEAMTYYWGDKYRSTLAAYGGYVRTGAPVEVISHCLLEDNAFFVRGKDDTGRTVEIVCLGDSTATPGASYSDDAAVTIHELQHATTTENYSTSGRLNQFWYDEAGALNEAVSDFMALAFTQPLLTELLDPRLFSRWALGAFIPGHSGARGTHRCPVYDPTYPDCGAFPSFSSANNTISYVYPDGVGWPYANNFSGPGYASSAFASYRSQEEIHNAGIVLEGALWDVYEALKANHGGDAETAHQLSSKVVMEAIRHLPQPTQAARSPVTFRGLADQMVAWGPSVGLGAQDQASMVAALTARGLQGGPLLPTGWSSVGPGAAGVTPGIRVQDNPTLLKTWLVAMTEEQGAAALVTQGIDTGLNNRLDPGELVALWFDIQNDRPETAGGVRVTVTSLDPEVTLSSEVNVGAIPGSSGTQAQIMYGKVNGTGVVAALAAANPTFHVPTGNSYFRTNPFFDCGDQRCRRGWTTAIWAKVSSTAAHGKVVRFQVEALPSNGAASVTEFTATIQ